MIRNYLKTAFRNLVRQKANTMINIAGMAIGFAAFLLIFLVIGYEQSFDQFHKAKDKLYRVVRVGKNPVNREYRTGVPFPVTMGIRMDFPQLANAGAIYAVGNAQVNIADPNNTNQKKFKEKTGVFLAEPQFFNMFNFPFAAGNPATLLNEPNTAALTKETAEKYFGDWKIATGKTIRLFNLDIKITGILENPPVNTDFPLRVVISYATLIKSVGLDNWGNIDDDNYCFVQLPANSSQVQLDQLLDGFTKKHITPVNPGYDLRAEPLGEIHYDERYGNFSGRTFSKELILALSLIGIFLLVIACVNFINLTTARAVNRAREVGVRKVMGGRRMQLIFQFFGETGITCFSSLLLAILIVSICLPLINNLLEIHLTTSILISYNWLLFLAAAFIGVTLLSGFYPALVMSGFNPATALKSLSKSEGGRGIPLRRALVVFQFVIAQTLIIGTLVVATQMDYFRNADMGFNREAVINASMPGDSLSRTKADVVRNELEKIPGIEKLSFSMFTPSGGGGWATDLRLPGNKSNSPDLIVMMKPADTSYFGLYHLQLLAGRQYFPSDTMRELVVNETLTRKLGFPLAKQAIGKIVNVNGSDYPIVGVIKDFHEHSLRDPISPMVMTTMKNGYQMTNIKIAPGKTKTALTAIENVWNRNFPQYVFEYAFLDQTVADYYIQENQLSTLYKIFSGIAVFISCLGLYGLVSFMAIRRRKEISIRKVLGAPVKDILVLLSREFTVLIALAFLIAAPVAWYFMNAWLQQYTYRIAMGLGFYVITIVASIGIAWLTVGYTAIKAASANPAGSLRAE